MPGSRGDLSTNKSLNLTIGYIDEVCSNIYLHKYSISHGIVGWSGVWDCGIS